MAGYLDRKRDAGIVLVGEAAGYRGARVSGVPFTSERQLTGTGPAEATALGNIAVQMLATGAVSSLDEARHIIERSFPVERFEPKSAAAWDAHYARFQDYVEMTCV